MADQRIEIGDVENLKNEDMDPANEIEYFRCS